MTGLLDIDLRDPALFAANAHRAALARLRAEAPVYRHPEPEGPGFWVVTRHRDALAVYADHETFSSRYGMHLDSDPEAVKSVSQRMMIVSDPPVHTELKRAVGRSFGPAEIAGIEPLVRRVVTEVLDEFDLGSGECDLAAVVKPIPNRVVCAIMGLPREDWEWIGELTTDAFESEDGERAGAHAELFLYFADLVRERRADPGDDFISRIVRGGEHDRALSVEEAVFNCNGVLAGANETTRHAAAGAVLAFARHRSQWTVLREAGPAAIPSAVEEILRWTTPGVHALRTATRDTVVGGVPIREGDRVTVWNASANDDEEVFARPASFDVARTPNRHLTFGSGRHVCIGARLARMEMAWYLEELLRRVSRIELTGEPRFTASNFTWGLRALPVRLT